MTKSIKIFLAFSAFTLFVLSFASAVTTSSNIETKIASDLLQSYSSVSADARLEAFLTLRTSDGKVPKDLSIVNELKRKYPGRIAENGYIEDAVIIPLTRSELTSLLSDKRIVFASSLPVGQISLQESVQVVNATGSWSQSINSTFLDGSGQTICLIDTGVDFSHPDLASKNALGGTNQLDCYTGSSCVLSSSITDLNGHGTHVAGILAASGGVNGVAKGANIVSAKIFPAANGSASNYPLVLRSAINWCIVNSAQYNISVISISSGTVALNSSVCDSWAQQMPVTLVANISIAVSKNISVVAATGNNGNSAAITAPACLSKVIPVGAVNKTGSLWSSSNYNSLVKIFAVGKSVTSTCIPSQGSGGYCVYSGTSQAAPMVSGAIAIINQELALKGMPRSMHPKQDIEPLLFSNGSKVTDLSFANWRLLNIGSATSSLLPPKPIQPIQVLGDLNGDSLVNETDLALLLEQWGQCPVNNECTADFNDDGFVDNFDLKLLLYDYWTPAPCIGNDVADCLPSPHPDYPVQSSD